MKCSLCGTADLINRRQTCIRCEQRTRSCLGRVMDSAQLLPAVFTGRAPSADDRVSGSHDLPMPGGTALVILGPGRDPSRFAVYPPPDPLGSFDRDGDPQPLVTLLGGWEDYWREEQHQPARGAFGSINVTILHTYRYLVANNYWAAEYLDAYPAYAEDLRIMLRTMQYLLDIHGFIERLAIPCPDCGDEFIRPNGASHIRCTGPDCGRIWPQEDYRRLAVIVLAEAEQAAARERAEQRERDRAEQAELRAIELAELLELAGPERATA